MESLIHADIFFLVTTISVALITILLIVVIVYVIQILKNIKKISQILKDGTVSARENIDRILEILSKNPIMKMFFGTKTERRSSGRSRMKTSKNEE